MIPSIGSCSRLYSCSQRVAFHVHTSRLLCRSNSVDFKQEVTGDISLQAAFEEDKRSVVDGMNMDTCAASTLILRRMLSFQQSASAECGLNTEAFRRAVHPASHQGRQRYGFQNLRAAHMQEMNVKEDDEESEEMTRKRKSRGDAKTGPRTCSEAIEMGLDCFDRGNFEQAVELFTLSLELPGNGAMRMSGSVKEYACPSEGEEQAALYNMACCYARLSEVESGLTCVKGLLESGFDDYETLRSDKDLEGLRSSPDFEAVIGKYDNLASKLLGRKKRKTEKKKSWLARW